MGPRKKDWLLDERLLQSQKLAAIGQLSAGIAHEINNPLAIIRQEAEWMQLLLKKLAGRDFQEIAELQGSVHQIVRQVDRCTEITRNLLDFARKRDPVIQAVEVNRVIEDMTMLVEKEARHNNITIVRQYDQELPVIYSDAPQLRQVILNFLTNVPMPSAKTGLSPSPRGLASASCECFLNRNHVGKFVSPS
jgi:two-component system NtrC family sensor kinase